MQQSSDDDDSGIRWWDINFENQDMEDMFRRMQSVSHLVQLRFFILFTELASFVYSAYMVDGIVNWTLRVLLFIFCLMVVPLTFKSLYLKYESYGDFMISSVLLIFSCIFLLISIIDKFDGVPTNGYLLMGVRRPSERTSAERAPSERTSAERANERTSERAPNKRTSAERANEHRTSERAPNERTSAAPPLFVLLFLLHSLLRSSLFVQRAVIALKLTLFNRC